jgi:large subunit ribosomal protein L7/L12
VDSLDTLTYWILGFLVFALMLLLEQVLRLRRRVQQLERANRPALPTSAADLPAAVQEKVWRLVQAGKKIEAIRVVRDGTGLGLKEAKELVERL